MEPSKSPNRNTPSAAAESRRHQPVTRSRVPRDRVEIDRDSLGDHQSTIEGVIVHLACAESADRVGWTREVTKHLREAIDLATLSLTETTEWVEENDAEQTKRSVEGTLTDDEIQRAYTQARDAAKQAARSESIDWSKLSPHIRGEQLRRDLAADVRTIREQAATILTTVRGSALLNPGDDSRRGREQEATIADRERLAFVTGRIVDEVSDAATRLLEVASCVEMNFALEREGA